MTGSAVIIQTEQYNSMAFEILSREVVWDEIRKNISNIADEYLERRKMIEDLETEDD